MTLASRLALAVGAAVLLAGCATGPRVRGPVTSPTGFVYPLGTPPQDTRFSQTAVLYLRQRLSERALDLAREGIAADSTNPVHYFLAGLALARLQDYSGADEMFDVAQRLYPAYELEIEPERAAAWADAFNAGADAYGRGEVEAAAAAWRDAMTMYDLRPEAHRNLAALLTREERYDEAITAYREALAGLAREPATRVLAPAQVGARAALARRTEEDLAPLLLLTGRFDEAEPLLRAQHERDPSSVRVRRDLALALEGMGRKAEATAIYTELLSQAGMDTEDLANLGITFFRGRDFTHAAEAFARLTTLQPDSRDAWFNYANALLAGSDWSTLAPVGARLVELDPLGENAGLITARAYFESGDPQTAAEFLERAESAPVHVEDLRFEPSPTATTVSGALVGNEAEPGTPVVLRFVFRREGETVSVETRTLPAPARDDRDPFEITTPRRASGYHYERLR